MEPTSDELGEFISEASAPAIRTEWFARLGASTTGALDQHPAADRLDCGTCCRGPAALCVRCPCGGDGLGLAAKSSSSLLKRRKPLLKRRSGSRSGQPCKRSRLVALRKTVAAEHTIDQVDRNLIWVTWHRCSCCITRRWAALLRRSSPSPRRWTEPAAVQSSSLSAPLRETATKTSTFRDERVAPVASARSVRFAVTILSLMVTYTLLSQRDWPASQSGRLRGAHLGDRVARNAQARRCSCAEVRQRYGSSCWSLLG